METDTKNGDFMQENYTLIFHHIPKTAGTSLSDIITRQYLSRKIYKVYGNRNIKINKFKSLNYQQRRKHKLIMGHQAINLVDVAISPVVLTMFRYPVDRVVSLYYYYRKNEKLYDHPLHKMTAKYDLEDFFKNGIDRDWPEFSDGQYLSLKSVLTSEKFGSREKNDPLDELKQIVKKHFVFGIQERFDESLLLFRSELNWNKPIYYQKRNVTPHERKYSKCLTDMIIDRNQKDVALYEFVDGEVNSKIRHNLKSCPTTLKSFQMENKRYAGYYTKKYQLYRFLKNIIQHFVTVKE